MKQRSPQEKAEQKVRRLGGGYGEQPVKVAELEAWARGQS
jgi:hypothetical protein